MALTRTVFEINVCEVNIASSVGLDNNNKSASVCSEDLLDNYNHT